MRQIVSGYCLPPPPECPRTIYDMMIKCWWVQAQFNVLVLWILPHAHMYLSFLPIPQSTSLLLPMKSPQPELQPTFIKIMVALQQPDFKILSWSPKDTRSLSENAMCLGAPLTEGESLFRSLQCTYIIQLDQEETQAQPKKTVKGETSKNSVAKSNCNNRATVPNHYCNSLNTADQETPLLAASEFYSTL